MAWPALAMIGIFSASCTTAYDSYGRPIQTVDPGAAVAGAAAAGVIGYSLGHDHDHYRRDGYYRGGYYYRGSYYDRPPRTYYRRY